MRDVLLQVRGTAAAFSMRRSLRALGLSRSPDGTTPGTHEPVALDEVIAQMVDWYRRSRVRWAVGLDEDGDGLSFEWGIHGGATFEVSVTRQVAIPESTYGPALYHMAAVSHFEPDADLRAVGKGHRWCFDPSEADEFGRWIGAEAVTRLTRDRPIVGQDVTAFERV